MCDAIGDSDTVVNLIGKHYETKHVCFTRKEDGSLNRINSSFKNVSALALPRAPRPARCKRQDRALWLCFPGTA